MLRSAVSLRTKLIVGAGLVAMAALMAAAVTIIGMDKVSGRIAAAVAAERRIEHYSILSTQVSGYIIVAAEAIQTGLPAEERAARLEALSRNIESTFDRLRNDHTAAVEEVAAQGLEVQSRRATQSIGLARMEALFTTLRDGLNGPETDPERLQGRLDNFAIRFDPLMNGVISEDKRNRNAIIRGIADLRRTLNIQALAVTAVMLVLLGGFLLGFLRPLLRRLDMLHGAARRIGQEDFAVTLPDAGRDEIGQLVHETNRMAETLAARQETVKREWNRLNATIAERTGELQQAVEELARTDENRRRFFADISHELRNPLAVILMEAEIGQKEHADARVTFDTIHARAQRLNRRIDDLLRIARSETGELALASAPFDLTTATREAVEDMAPHLNSAGMSVEVTDDGPPVMAEGDRNWLRQVVAGLIENAIRHARSGGSIALRTWAEDGMAHVSLTDHGSGIPPQAQAEIFERFRQAEGAVAGGFGIGLALAKWIVEQQGGRILLESPLDRASGADHGTGTKVTVSIPRPQE